jgi:uncharacterized protein YegJ (DUF2314 family)
MVQCPVGNRCPKCAGKFTSHVLAVTPGAMLKTLAAAAAAGFAFGWADSFLPLGGILMMFFVYLGGVAAGNVVHKISGHKMGPKISTTVVAGLVVGALLSPVGERALNVFHIVTRDDGEFKAVRFNREERKAKLAKSSAEARKAYPDFELSFKRKTGENHSVKFPFTIDDTTEHMWISVNDISGTKITGVLMNDPIDLVELKPGDVVTRDASELEDWEYRDSNGVHGSFSSSVLQEVREEHGGSDKELEKQARIGWLFSSLISLAIFGVGVCSPFMGFSPVMSGRNWFRR